MRYGPPKAVTSCRFEVMCFLVTHKTYQSTTWVLLKVKNPKPPQVFNLCIQETLSGKRGRYKHTPFNLLEDKAPCGHTGQASVGVTGELTAWFSGGRGTTLEPDGNKMSLQINEKSNPEVLLVLYFKSLFL